MQCYGKRNYRVDKVALFKNIDEISFKSRRKRIINDTCVIAANNCLAGEHGCIVNNHANSSTNYSNKWRFEEKLGINLMQEIGKNRMML